MHITIIERSYDLEDSVHLTDMREEFIPEPLPFTRPRDESRDIDELDGRRDDLRAVDSLAKLFETVVIDIDDTGIRLDGTEREIRRLRRVRLGECIKQSRFTDIRESDDSYLHGE